MTTEARPTVYTIGHSTRPIGDFLALLEAHGISGVVDVRTIPRSRRNPQFNQEELRKSLARAGIRYRHLKALGGLRHALRDSVNMGWRNLSFRGFADYMQTEEFDRGLELLEAIARKQPTAIMCAEGNPWRCHRSLIADALIKRKWRVFEISSRRTARSHKLTPFLRMRKGRLVYPLAGSQNGNSGAVEKPKSCHPFDRLRASSERSEGSSNSRRIVTRRFLAEFTLSAEILRLRLRMTAGSEGLRMTREAFFNSPTVPGAYAPRSGAVPIFRAQANRVAQGFV